MATDENTALSQGSSIGVVAEGDFEDQHCDEAAIPDDAFVWYHMGISPNPESPTPGI